MWRPDWFRVFSGIFLVCIFLHMGGVIGVERRSFGVSASSSVFFFFLQRPLVVVLEAAFHSIYGQ